MSTQPASSSAEFTSPLASKLVQFLAQKHAMAYRYRDEGYIKGKSAIHLARVYGERKRNFVGQHFWARGYFVSTVGRDEAVIRSYIEQQEAEDKRLDQLNLDY